MFPEPKDMFIYITYFAAILCCYVIYQVTFILRSGAV